MFGQILFDGRFFGRQFGGSLAEDTAVALIANFRAAVRVQGKLELVPFVPASPTFVNRVHGRVSWVVDFLFSHIVAFVSSIGKGIPGNFSENFPMRKGRPGVLPNLPLTGARRARADG